MPTHQFDYSKHDVILHKTYIIFIRTTSGLDKDYLVLHKADVTHDKQGYYMSNINQAQWQSCPIMSKENETGNKGKIIGRHLQF